jgi:RNA 2',3'-cyclic 3'-phosphodiesterase
VAKRLFIAADVDEATRDQIAVISRSLRESIGTATKASWVRADKMHLTLQFFAAAESSVELRILAALAEPIQERPFDLSLESVGFFPGHGSPRVLWLGIRRGAAELVRVQGILQSRLALPPERETFKPHLTLARFRERVSRAKLAQIAKLPALAGPARIDRVTLYESCLSPAGPSYVRLAEAPLQP